jgi:hypothetical protein
MLIIGVQDYSDIVTGFAKYCQLLFGVMNNWNDNLFVNMPRPWIWREPRYTDVAPILSGVGNVFPSHIDMSCSALFIHKAFFALDKQEQLNQQSNNRSSELTPRCRVFFAFFMEPKGSSPSSQKPATGPYPEPAESMSPHRSVSP